MPDDDDQCSIHISFDTSGPDASFAGESMWAFREGDGPEPNTGLYRINNIPFFADLRFEDLVICEEGVMQTEPLEGMDPSTFEPYEKRPEFVAIAESSPRRTVTVLFNPEMPDDTMIPMMHELRDKCGVNIERAVATVWAAAMPADPAMEEEAMRLLDEMHEKRYLDYEADDRD